MSKESSMNRTRTVFPGVRLRGFSLIELLVVLVILGLIGGLVAPRVMSQFDSARVDAARAQLTRLAADLDIYRLNTGQYPRELVDLVERPGDARNWKGPYVQRKALLDPWGNALRYRIPGEHGPYDLYSLGPDGDAGDPGGDGVIANWQ
jgi:general secretion pathway protein G